MDNLKTEMKLENKSKKRELKRGKKENVIKKSVTFVPKFVSVRKILDGNFLYLKTNVASEINVCKQTYKDSNNVQI